MAGRIVRVRIRGIYATALTKWALEQGFQIVQASNIIASRLGIPQLELPADVTIKESESDPSELLIVGYTWATRQVLDRLRGLLPYSFYWVSRLPLHATVKARVTREADGKCYVEVGGVEAVVNTTPCPPRDTTIIGGVVKPAVKPYETPQILPGARLIGDYAIVYETEHPKVTISEHVYDHGKQAELVSLALEYTSKGLGVHWRSNSKYASRETLKTHLAELHEKLQKVKEEASRSDTGVYSEGETVALIRLSRIDKENLDKLRGRVVATAPWHHTVKSVSPNMSIVVDYAEKLLQYDTDEDKLLSSLLDLYTEKLQQAKTIRLIHVKPDGSIIELGKAKPLHVEKSGSKLRIVVERIVRSRGVYDGLNIEKEPGDRIVTEIDTSSWVIIHKYYSPRGEHKGTYYNINTPPEIGEDMVVYLDLEADIVKKPNGESRVVDLEKLEKMYRDGIITREMLEKIHAVVDTLAPRHRSQEQTL